MLIFEIKDCDQTNCPFNKSMRCYDNYDLDNVNISMIKLSKKCKCLKGLYLHENNCVNVVRYDFKFDIFESSYFVDQITLTSQIKELV